MAKKQRKFINKAQWHEIDGKRYFFRSLLEFRCAKMLQLQKVLGKIADWLHEPQTFWFEGIKRGCVSYLPDFKVINLDGSHYWVEAKGYWDAKSLTKVKRFRKYFPQENLICIEKIH